MSLKFVQKNSFHINKIYLKYSFLLLLTCSHNNNPTHLVHTPLVKGTFSPHYYYMGTWWHYVDHTLFKNIPPSIFYLNQTTGRGNIFLDSGGTITFSDTLLYPKLVSSSQNIKNPPIVPFVFSGQSPDQTCWGNFWNSEDPSKTVIWAFWFLELSCCKFHAQKNKNKSWKKMSISLCMCRVLV